MTRDNSWGLEIARLGGHRGSITTVARRSRDQQRAGHVIHVFGGTGFMTTYARPPCSFASVAPGRRRLLAEACQRSGRLSGAGLPALAGRLMQSPRIKADGSHTTNNPRLRTAADRSPRQPAAAVALCRSRRAVHTSFHGLNAAAWARSPVVRAMHGQARPQALQRSLSGAATWWLSTACASRQSCRSKSSTGSVPTGLCSIGSTLTNRPSLGRSSGRRQTSRIVHRPSTR